MNFFLISYHFRKNENIELNFGDKVELGSVPKLYLHVIIIIIGFLINVQVQGHHPHQWAPFQVTG